MPKKSKKILTTSLSSLLIALPTTAFANSESENVLSTPSEKAPETVIIAQSQDSKLKSETPTSESTKIKQDELSQPEASDNNPESSPEQTDSEEATQITPATTSPANLDTETSATTVQANEKIAVEGKNAPQPAVTEAETPADAEVEADTESSADNGLDADGQVATLADTLLDDEEDAALPAGLQTADLSTGITPEQLVQSLLGKDVVIQNVKYIGSKAAAGTFTGGKDIIGFNSGIILSSGNIAYVVGPNDADGKGQSNGSEGDSDLSSLIPGYNVYDASVLEFDFIPVHDTLTFSYVFSSEEYNEYTNSSYNDVFGFFINGKNMALIPGTTTPVAINTVNGGKPIGTNAKNPEYFRNNDLSDGGGSINTQMDGLTKVLTVLAKVNIGEINHIKMAIGDAGDTILDSNVFIQAGSFTSVDKIPPSCPVVKAVADSDTQIIGTTDPNTLVYAKVDGKEIGKSSSDNEGNFVIAIAKQKAGAVITIFAEDDAGNVCDSTKVTVTGEIVTPGESEPQKPSDPTPNPTEPSKPAPEPTKPSDPVKPTPIENGVDNQPGKLPNTATNMFNLLFAGMALTVIGGIRWFSKKLTK